MSGPESPEDQDYDGHDEDRKPFPLCFSDAAWKPTATKVENVHLKGYGSETDVLQTAASKIPETEVALLHDLLSEIFMFGLQKRINSTEVLSHSLFHTDNQLSNT